jgi:hypothetical protein
MVEKVIAEAASGKVRVTFNPSKLEAYNLFVHFPSGGVANMPCQTEREVISLLATMLANRF